MRLPLPLTLRPTVERLKKYPAPGSRNFVRSAERDTRGGRAPRGVEFGPTPTLPNPPQATRKKFCPHYWGQAILAKKNASRVDDWITVWLQDVSQLVVQKNDTIHFHDARTFKTFL